MGTLTSGSTGTDVSFQGHIKGGQQPVSHATIQLYAVNTSAYSGAASVQLTSAIQTDANGAFNFEHHFDCPTDTSTLVYLVATNGNPGFDESGGTINNNALSLMAAIGRCDSLTPASNIEVSELSTVAAVWALAPFMKSYDHVGTTAGNKAGLINAFAMANTLVSTATGNMPGETAPTNVIVPAVELNSMANILASCVNTKGYTAGDKSPCDNLFTLAQPPVGGIVPHRVSPHVVDSNPVPTDTIEAALDIALNPGNNVAAIAALPTPQAPFQPAGANPNDWTVAVNFPVAGARSTNGMAFDATGNLWIAASDALYEMSPTGTILGTVSAMAGNSVAIDAVGNIWVPTASNTLSEMPFGSTTVANFTATNGASTIADGLAIDGFGNPWYTCDNCTAVYKLNLSDSSIGTFGTAGNSRQTNISIDGSEHIWLGNSALAQMDIFDDQGTPIANSPLNCGTCGHPSFVANDGAGNAWIIGSDLTHLIASTDARTNYDNFVGGLINSASVAIDGAGNAWVANLSNVPGLTTNASGSISEFSSSDVVISPATGYVNDTIASPQSIAVDGSGSVWVRNTGSATVTAFIGAGVPVVTPLALGVKNNSVGSGPQ